MVYLVTDPMCATLLLLVTYVMCAVNLQTLGLASIASSIIGSVADRGISGGQRKRVSIAMELVSNPAVLLLDEPTSGQDASTAMVIARSLLEICNMGVTVVVVLHQPRPEIFNALDQLLLLTKHGQVNAHTNNDNGDC